MQCDVGLGVEKLLAAMADANAVNHWKATRLIQMAHINWPRRQARWVTASTSDGMPPEGEGEHIRGAATEARLCEAQEGEPKRRRACGMAV